MSDLFLRAARGENTAVAPVWCMRQAGRYLPEYRALRAQHDFWTLCRTPELAAEVTLQPLRRFEMDAAILFADIMTPLPALGVDIDFRPGPVVAEPIRTLAQVEGLTTPDAKDIAPFTMEAIQRIRAATDTPLIGFGGAPFTLACYLVEGKGSKDYGAWRTMMRAEPETAERLLERLADLTIAYLLEQVASGAQAVQLFDSWAGLLSETQYRRFALPANTRILKALEACGVPRIYIAVDAWHLMPALAELPVEVLSVDWRVPLDRVRATQPAGRCLQGNLDPTALFAPRNVLLEEVDAVLRAGKDGAHIFNLGHGILPGADPEALGAVVRRVRETDRHALKAKGEA